MASVHLPSALQKLVRELSKLPSIGEKTATRLAYHLVHSNRGLAISLADALKDSAQQVQTCASCHFLCDGEVCAICSDNQRDQGVVCVVEKPMDLIAIERIGDFKGVYHVLHGVWAPLRGQGAESLRLSSLLERAKAGTIREAILATGSTVEGDATALYVARVLSELNVKTSRLAQGMPKGSELEYADEVTLSRALSGRVVLG